MKLPYLTSEISGIGGTLKDRPEDFFVQEIPLYEPSGEGEHVYAEIQKVGLTTFETVHRLSKALRVHEKDIGYAGLKDARAITRQVFSILGTTEQAVMNLQIPGLSIRWAARHGNKLRLGHLSGNRFAIKIRNVIPTDVVKLRPILKVLEKRGLPNYFGEQRFGRRGNNDQLGAALIRGDNVAVLQDLLGKPDPAIDDADSLRARAAFDARDNDTAMRLYPRNCGLERRVLARLMKTRKPNAAVRAIDEKLRKLWISALQSRIFNEVVSHRITTIDRLMDGDLAYLHENGACFLVESAVAEQARCDAFEISASGPLVGYRMTLPTGEPLRIEQEVLAKDGLTPASFRTSDYGRVKGARRPIRVKPADTELAAGADEFGPYITVAFSLPSGSYATVLLSELMKTDASSLRAASATGGDEGSDAQDDEDAAENGHERLAGDSDGIDGGFTQTDSEPSAGRDAAEQSE
jgi:tRNA pseudouridine13 synthase